MEKKILSVERLKIKRLKVGGEPLMRYEVRQKSPLFQFSRTPYGFYNGQDFKLDSARAVQILRKIIDGIKKFSEEKKTTLLFHYLFFLVEKHKNRFAAIELLQHKKNEEVVERFTKKTVLHIAAENGWVDVLTYAFNQGNNLSVQDSLQMTPLSYAIRGQGLDKRRDFIQQLVEYLATTRFQNEPDIPSIAVQERLKWLWNMIVELGFDVNQRNSIDRTALAYTIQENDVSAFEQLLVVLNADAESITSRGDSVLHCIAETKDSDPFLRLFVELTKGAINLDKKNGDGFTPLHLALKSKNYYVALSLIALGADVLLTDSEGNTVIHFAVEGDPFQFIPMFVKRGVDINAHNIKGESAIWGAFTHRGGAPLPPESERNQKCLVRLQQLISSEADPSLINQAGESLLHLVPYRYSRELVDTLIPHGLNVNQADAQGKTPIFEAVQSGCLAAFLHFLELGADCLKVDNQGNTLFHQMRFTWFSPEDYKRVLALLIERGLKIEQENHDSQTPLDFLIAGFSRTLEPSDKKTWLGHIECFLDSGANALPLSAPALSEELRALPAAHENKKRLRTLTQALANEALQDSRDEWGETPVLFAMKSKKWPEASQLIGRGADCRGTDSDQNTVFHLAAESESPDIQRSLIENWPAMMNTADKKGRTPLLLALKKNKCEYAIALLAAGADYRALDHNGRSVFHYLKFCKKEDDISRRLPYLRDWREGIETRDTYGYTPLLFSLKTEKNIPYAMTLIRLAVNVNTATNGGDNVWHFAVLNNEMAFTEFLRGYTTTPLINTPNHQGVTPLMYAACEEVKNMLLSLGATLDAVDEKGNTPIHHWTKGYIWLKRNQQFIKFDQIPLHLLNQRNQKGKTPLQKAIEYGNTRVAKQLLNLGVNCQGKDSNNNTLLHCIAGQNLAHKRDAFRIMSLHLSMKRINHIIEKNRETINDKNKDGYTALHLALMSGDDDLIEALLKAGADSTILFNGKEDTATPLRFSSLHLLSMDGNPFSESHRTRVMTELNRRGNDINQLSRENLTPLQIALGQPKWRQARLLISMGADCSSVHLQDLNQEYIRSQVNYWTEFLPSQESKRIDRIKATKFYKFLQLLIAKGAFKGDARPCPICKTKISFIETMSAFENNLFFKNTPEKSEQCGITWESSYPLLIKTPCDQTRRIFHTFEPVHLITYMLRDCSGEPISDLPSDSG